MDRDNILRMRKYPRRIVKCTKFADDRLRSFCMGGVKFSNSL